MEKIIGFKELMLYGANEQKKSFLMLANELGLKNKFWLDEFEIEEWMLVLEYGDKKWQYKIGFNISDGERCLKDVAAFFFDLLVCIKKNGCVLDFVGCGY